MIYETSFDPKKKRLSCFASIKIANNACFKRDGIKRLLVLVEHVGRDLRIAISSLIKCALGESFVSLIIELKT